MTGMQWIYGAITVVGQHLTSTGRCWIHLWYCDQNFTTNNKHTYIVYKLYIVLKYTISIAAQDFCTAKFWGRLKATQGKNNENAFRLLMVVHVTCPCDILYILCRIPYYQNFTLRQRSVSILEKAHFYSKKWSVTQKYSFGDASPRFSSE